MPNDTVRFRRSRITLPTASYFGMIQEYDFRRLTRQYQHIREIMNGLNYEPLIMVGADRRRYGQQFVAWAGDRDNASFVWYKYVGNTPGQGQNWVYCRDHGKIKTSQFLLINPLNGPEIPRGVYWHNVVIRRYGMGYEVELYNK